MFSITKTVVSALVGIAVRERKLAGVDERLADVFPEEFGSHTDPRKRSITLGELLSMTSGFCCTPAFLGDPVPELIQRPLGIDPGSGFHYDGGSSDLLSAALAKVTGMTAAQYAQAHLFAPLGIRGVRWDALGKRYSGGAAGLFLRPRELLAFGQLYLDDGRWRGKEVVPAAWVRQSTRAHVRVDRGIAYGYDWWITADPAPGFAALGYGGQALFVFPRLDLVVVVTAASDDERPRLVLAELAVRAAQGP